jgi:hypothetical protein
LKIPGPDKNGGAKLQPTFAGYGHIPGCENERHNAALKFKSTNLQFFAIKESQGVLGLVALTALNL